MMTQYKITEYGVIFVLNQEDIFEKTVQGIEEVGKQLTSGITVGLTGGSTPKAFYKWAAEGNAFRGTLLDRIIWMASDERYVPLESDDSNFGNADRLMLEPLEVAEKNKRPWAVEKSPEEAAKEYNAYFTGEACFDVCLLGMGDDCHTASIFPNSPLLDDHATLDMFTAVDVPVKGQRLTITPEGLKRCGKIIVTATGPAKVEALNNVFNEYYEPKKYPIQILRECSQKVTWLLDQAAAAELKLENLR